MRSAECGMSGEASLGERLFMSIPHSEFRIPHSVRGAAVQIVDSHVPFWDPGGIHYTWLKSVPALDRAFLPSDYAAATPASAIPQLGFWGGNCRPARAPREP